MIAHHKVNVQRAMRRPPMREIIYFAVVLAVKKVAGNDKALCMMMSEYAREPKGIALLGAARHRNAMFAEVGGFAPMHI